MLSLIGPRIWLPLAVGSIGILIGMSVWPSRLKMYVDGLSTK